MSTGSRPKRMDLGLQMAVAAVQAALADLPRFVGLRLFADGGARAAALRSAMLPTPGTAPGTVPTPLLWQEYLAGPGGAMQLRGSPEAVDAASALRRLDKALSKLKGEEAALILVTRTGATSFEFDGRGGVRRSGLRPDQVATVFADLPAPRLRERIRTSPSVAEGKAGPAEQSPEAVIPEARVPETIAWPQHAVEEAQSVAPVIRDILSPARAGALLEAIGLLSPSGQVKRDERRKFNQIVHLIGLIADPIGALPRDRSLTVVDCGCGKSQLLFVLNHVLTEGLGLRAHLVGLDVSQQAIATARSLQARLGYANMEFAATSIRTWDPPTRLDAVLSLHACDTATDEAIALGIAARSPVIVAVPCCQAELAGQVRGQAGGDGPERVFSHGVLRRRFGDWITDALRVLYLEASGYDVDVLEYVSPLDTPKNIMLRARLTGSHVKSRDAAAQAFQSLCAKYGLDPSLPRLRQMLEARFHPLV